MKKIPSATSGMDCSFVGIGVASEECKFYKIYPKMLLLWFFAMRCTFFPSNLCFGQKQNFVQKGQDQEIIWSFDDSISIDWFYLMPTKRGMRWCLKWAHLVWRHDCLLKNRKRNHSLLFPLLKNNTLILCHQQIKHFYHNETIIVSSYPSLPHSSRQQLIPFQFCFYLRHARSWSVDCKNGFLLQKKETSVAGSFIHSIECILTHSQNIQHKICIRPIPLFTECVKFWRTHRSVCTCVSRRLQWGWHGVAVTVIFWIKLKTECILQKLSWKYFKKLFLMNFKAFGEYLTGVEFSKNLAVWQQCGTRLNNFWPLVGYICLHAMNAASIDQFWEIPQKP